MSLHIVLYSLHFPGNRTTEKQEGNAGSWLQSIMDEISLGNQVLSL
jgi:hypothetical protein